MKNNINSIKDKLKDTVKDTVKDIIENKSSSKIVKEKEINECYKKIIFFLPVDDETDIEIRAIASNNDERNKTLRDMHVSVEFYRAFRTAYCLWAKVNELRKKNEIAEAVLTAYYRNDKVLDNIRRLIQFADEEIDYSDDYESLALMGYNNYVIVLKHNTKKLIETGKKLMDFEEPKAEKTLKYSLWFIEKYCQKIPSVKDIAKEYLRIENLKKKIKAGEQCFNKDIRPVYLMFDELGHANNSDIKSLEKMAEEFTAQKQLIEKNISKATNLYTLVNKLLTDELFDALKPENIKIKSVNELKKIYINSLNKLSALTEKNN